MQQALLETEFFGLTTNRDYLARILAHPKFKEGMTYTHFVETYKEDLLPREIDQDSLAYALACYLLEGQGTKVLSSSSSGSRVWDELSSFRNV